MSAPRVVSGFELRRIVADALEKHRPDLDRRISWARARAALEREGRVALGTLVVVLSTVALLCWGCGGAP